MLLTGHIAAGDGVDTTAPRAEDQVLAFSALDGRLVGSATVTVRGEYSMVIGRTASFNGTPVALELLQGNRRYALLRDGVPVLLVFHGYTLPEKTTLPIQVGAKTTELLPSEASNPQAQRLSRQPELPCTPYADANGDGTCDKADWEIMRLYGGGVARAVAHP